MKQLLSFMSNRMEKDTWSEDKWYVIDNVQDVPSPALLIHPDRIEDNIGRMIAIGGAGRLRPHVKTHKMAEIVHLQMEHGIGKFKCATLAEAEMVARCGARDILLAVQPVGPNIGRFFRLKQEFRDSKISCIADSEDIISKISRVAAQTGLIAGIWLDINNGMNRTGILPDKNAAKLFKFISDQPMLTAEGLHVYDGHIHEKDPAKRKEICEEAFGPVRELLSELRKTGNPSLPVVAGGTPTFPIHAGHGKSETSPGTLLLWDYGYSSSFADLDFLHAAILLTRVVSKPGRNLICLDLGHKAVASEMPQPRIKFFGLDNYEIVGHNEEHMVVRTGKAGMFRTGDALYGIPWHICPTVDRYDSVTVVREGRAEEEWKVEARRRRITI